MTTTTATPPECLICGYWIGDVEGDDLESNRCADHPVEADPDPRHPTAPAFFGPDEIDFVDAFGIDPRTTVCGRQDPTGDRCGEPAIATDLGIAEGICPACLLNESQSGGPRRPLARVA